MRRWVVMIVMMAVLQVAQASSTYRVGSQVLTVGDSAARAVQLLGQPDYREPLENTFGAYQGERWQFEQGRTTLIVTIVQGRVGNIEEVRA